MTAILATVPATDSTATWLQILLQAGAFGLLILLAFMVPKWLKDAREARQKEQSLLSKERAEEREMNLQERKEEREARHSLANQFQQAVIGMMASSIQTSREDRAEFERRNKALSAEITTALREQTAQLSNKLDHVHEGLTEVQKMVVRAQQVTVVPEKKGPT